MKRDLFKEKAISYKIINEIPFGVDIKFLSIDRNNGSSVFTNYSIRVEVDQNIFIYLRCSTENFYNYSWLVNLINSNIKDYLSLNNVGESFVLFINDQFFNKYLHETEIWPDFIPSEIIKIVDKQIKKFGTVHTLEYILNDFYNMKINNKNSFIDKFFDFVSFKSLMRISHPFS